MKKNKTNLPPLEEGLLRALVALDNQIAREMQRGPSEMEAHGVRKDEPYNKRVESLTAFVLNSLGEGDITLDGVIVLSQVFSKTLQFISEDLGRDGLGKMRTRYFEEAIRQVSEDCRKASEALGGTRELM